MSKLRHKEQKLTRTRLRRVDKTFLRLCEAFLVLSAFFFITVWVSHRPSLYITKIEVEGAHAVDAKDVHDTAGEALRAELLGDIQRNNTYLYPSAAVEASIKLLSPRIAYTHISFPDRHTLVASVVEYSPTFLYCQKTLPLDASASSTEGVIPRDCYFADEKGYVFSAAPEYIGYPFVAIPSACLRLKTMQ